MEYLPFTALRAFAAVYQNGGVRAAARSLNVSHSAVLRHVRELERWLGVALFETRPGSSKMVVSAQGKALGSAVVEQFSELGRAVQMVRERKDPNSVTIATTPSIAARWLIPRLPDLRQQHPWISVSVIPVQSVLGTREQGADLVIRMGSGPWPEPDAKPLMDDWLAPVCSPEYWSGLAGVSPTEKMRSAALLHDRDPAASWEKWTAQAPDWRVDATTGMRFSSSDLVLDAAVAGLGIALARGRLAEHDIARGGLIRPFGDDCVDLPDAYWLIPNNGLSVSSAISMTADWIVAQSQAIC